MEQGPAWAEAEKPGNVLPAKGSRAGKRGGGQVRCCLDQWEEPENLAGAREAPVLPLVPPNLY